jgi:hypothetical protein
MRQRRLAGTGSRRMRGKRMLFGSTHARKQGRYEKGKHSSSLGNGIAGISRCRGRHWLSTRTKGCCFRRGMARKAGRGGVEAAGELEREGGPDSHSGAAGNWFACSPVLSAHSSTRPGPFSTNPRFRSAIGAIHSLWKLGTRLLLRQAHDSDITHMRTRLFLLDRTGPGDGVWSWGFVFLAFAVQVKVFRVFWDGLASVRRRGLGGGSEGSDLVWVGLDRTGNSAAHLTACRSVFHPHRCHPATQGEHRWACEQRRSQLGSLPPMHAAMALFPHGRFVGSGARSSASPVCLRLHSRGQGRVVVVAGRDRTGMGCWKYFRPGLAAGSESLLLLAGTLAT